MSLDLSPTPIGEQIPRYGEPRSAYAVVYPERLRSGVCNGIITVTRDLLERRGADRSDQHYIASLADAAALLGESTVADLVATMMHANAGWFDLAVDSWQFKVLRYGQGHWAPPHVDMFPGSMRRKLTLVTHLTKPGTYMGGHLEVQTMGEPWQRIKLGLGSCAVFPAWTRHRVTRIDVGERWTLAAWGYGDPVR